MFNNLYHIFRVYMQAKYIFTNPNSLINLTRSIYTVALELDQR